VSNSKTNLRTYLQWIVNTNFIEAPPFGPDSCREGVVHLRWKEGLIKFCYADPQNKQHITPTSL